MIPVGGEIPFPNKALHGYRGSAGFLGNIYPACQTWMWHWNGMCILLFSASWYPQHNPAPKSFIIASAKVCFMLNAHLCCFCCIFSLLPAFAASTAPSAAKLGAYCLPHTCQHPCKMLECQQGPADIGEMKTGSNLCKRTARNNTLPIAENSWWTKKKPRKLAVICKGHSFGNQPKLLMASVCGNIIPEFLPFHCLWVLLLLLPSRSSCMMSTNLLNSACSLLIQHLVPAIREVGGNQ